MKTVKIVLLALLCLPFLEVVGQRDLTFSVRNESDLKGIEGVEIELTLMEDPKQPIPGTQIAKPGEDYEITDLNKGYYHIKISKNFRLKGMLLRADGYKEIAVSDSLLEQSLREIFLQPNAFAMNEVVEIVDRQGTMRDAIPVDATEISSEEVSLMNAQTSADLLQASGEVFVQKSQMGGGSPNIRGFEANKVLIVVDGVRLNNAIFRGGHLQNVISIDQNMLEKVEILYGPGSVMYGSDALGGVMHFYTRDPDLSKGDSLLVSGNAFLRTSSANFEKSAHFDLDLGWQRFSSMTSVTVSDYDDLVSGSRYHPDYPEFGQRPFYADRINGQDSLVANDNVQRQRYSGYSQLDILQKFHLGGRESTFEHNLVFQLSTSTNVPRYDRLSEVEGAGLRYSEWYYGPQQRMAVNYRGEAKGVEGKRGIHSVAWTLSYQDLEESRHTRRFGNVSLRDRTESVQVMSLNVDAGIRFNDRHKLSYGLEGNYNRVRSVAFTENIETGEIGALPSRYPDGGSEMQFLAGYLQDQYDIIADELTLTTGIRLNQIGLQARFEDKTFFPFLSDEVRQSSFAPSGSAGLSWRPTNEWKFRTVVATGFRAPNVDDVAKTFDSEPGTVIVPNPELRPEYTYNFELGARYTLHDKLDIDASGFTTLLDNALQVRDFAFDGQDSIVYDGILSRVQALQNVRQAWLAGFHIRLNWQFSRHFGMRHTTSLTRGRERDTDIPLDHIPPLFGRTELRYQGKRVLVQAYAQYNAWKRIEDYSPSGEDNQKYATADGMPAWYTLNLKGSFAINKNLKVQGGIENILDRHYRVFASGISAPGRNFILTVRASF